MLAFRFHALLAQLGTENTGEQCTMRPSHLLGLTLSIGILIATALLLRTHAPQSDTPELDSTTSATMPEPALALESERSPTHDPASTGTPATPAESSSVQETPPRARSEKDLWLKKWGHLTSAQLEAQYREMTLELTRIANPFYEEAFQRGDYEVVGEGTSYTIPSDWDPTLLVQIRTPGQGAADMRITKVLLRESDYPDLYALRRESLWISERARTLPLASGNPR